MAVPTVTADELIAEVVYHLSGRTTADATLTGRVRRRLALNQVKLSTSNARYFFRASLQIVTVAGTATYDLPDDFHKIAGRFLTFDDTTQYRCKVTSHHDINEMFGAYVFETDARPSFFLIQDVDVSDGLARLRFYPTPDAVYTVNGDYYAKAGDIRTTGDPDQRIPWQLRDILISMTALQFPELLTREQIATLTLEKRELMGELESSSQPVEGDYVHDQRFNVAWLPNQMGFVRIPDRLFP